MAESLQQIKKRIKTANSIAQISKAMEMIAASKIKKAQNAVEKNRPYAERVKYIVQKILAENNENSLTSYFLEVKKKNINSKLVYVISPDKGLCGGLLANIFKQVSNNVSKQDYVVAIGKKAQVFCIKNGYNVIASFNMGTLFPKYADIFPMLKIIQEFYRDKKVSSVEVIYTYFKNRLVQEPTAKILAPIQKDENFINKGDHIFEPSSSEVFKSLIPYYFEVIFYDILMNAYASEQAARMASMSNAKENANEISSSLTMVYNKSRQEKITNEILDLANGQIKNAI
ncbi:MAG: ATP synthase F1 subunit gamma [Endomicrobiaceae bacterium]|jgi:F-type H+-transporting ATPase subunit gamma|nr:ATP synthase F1 subunit gamma [Endomicrobiaceae bacterium]